MGRRRDINLESRLVLQAWANDLFGYGSTREMLSDLERSNEGFDGEGRSGVFHRLSSQSARLKLPLADLERYDENVRRHLEAINHQRPEPVTLRYFQHLAALYAEVFLDRWSTDKDALADELNVFAAGLEEPMSFEADDLNKLAFWMATGSGKTLIMHLNYHQFLHYVAEPPDNVLLITPNAGLTEQHLEEMRKSGIPCERFSAQESGLGLASPETVRVIEITKLTRNKKGGGESVDVESFEGQSLIFVDEGHKGAGDGKDSNLDRAWRPLRNSLADKGFTFEYSATFGQAVQASGSRDLADEYGKAILFDYSYRHFYEDGYGKDFRILNLKNQTNEYTDLLLLGNLLSFHEQRRYFRENREELKDYGLQPPLWVFVGSSVTKKEQSDIGTVSRFLHRFLKNEGGWSVETMDRILRGETGLRDADDRDAFAGRFGYLKDGPSALEIYEDVLREVFHAGAGGALHVADIKGADGEIGLRVSGAERYFGLIYIGDTSAFKRLLEADAPEITVEDDAITGGLFGEIDDPDSRVNVLIGAKKFIEGWDSWRVSNMGLLNIGKSEGSQIIQLFGRGVRLKGRDFSLKRSSFLSSPDDHPKNIDLLETLDIFAVQANYMAEFRRYLEREGVDPGGYEEIPFPIHRKGELIGEGLYFPAVPEGRDFAEEIRIVLDEKEDIRVNLDLSVRTEAMRMGKDGVATVAAKAGEGRPIEEKYLSMLDWSAIHLDLLNYKEAKGLSNLLIPPDAPRRIMKKDPARYNLVADDAVFRPRNFAGLAELQEAVQAILRKYVDKFYGVRWQRWDSKNMVLRELTGSHPNFADYTVKIISSEEKLIEEVRALANRVDGAFDEVTGSLPNVFFDRHLYQPLLKDRGEEIKVSPPGLEESEEKFVSALRNYCAGKNGGLPPGTKLFLLRNLTRSKGVGFFDTSGFYPDFIMWVKYADGSQKVVFVEPHGMRNDNPPPNNDKVDLYLELRDLSDRIEERDGPRGVFLDSYIISATPFHELSKKWGEGWTRERFARRHVLFEEDLDAGISVILEPRDKLERRISTSYPSPLAHGYRSLVRAGDPRDLYREQLRFAENVLAFLASVSIALLKEEDRRKAGLDLKKYWSGGISPGDWKEIIQRCSKVFAGYEDVPLARAIHRLKIGTEQKGFGMDVIRLIRAKNDYKHDRGPTDVEEIARASDELQERLRRCIEALAFFADYPILRVEGIDRNDDIFSLKCLRYVGDRPDLPREDVALHERPRGDGLFLDSGGENWVPLHPFILPTACSDGEVRETYFIDAWDTKKGVARMKSFGNGRTTRSEEVAEALAKWSDNF